MSCCGKRCTGNKSVSIILHPNPRLQAKQVSRQVANVVVDHLNTSSKNGNNRQQPQANPHLSNSSSNNNSSSSNNSNSNNNIPSKKLPPCNRVKRGNEIP